MQIEMDKFNYELMLTMMKFITRQQQFSYCLILILTGNYKGKGKREGIAFVWRKNKHKNVIKKISTQFSHRQFLMKSRGILYNTHHA